MPIKPKLHLFQQPLKRMSKEVELKVKKEIENLLKAKFIIPTRFVQWLANISPMMKKNGKLRVCVDFRGLKVSTPKDMYVMPIVDMLVDSTTNKELLSFMADFCHTLTPAWAEREDATRDWDSLIDFLTLVSPFHI